VAKAAAANAPNANKHVRYLILPLGVGPSTVTHTFIIHLTECQFLSVFTFLITLVSEDVERRKSKIGKDIINDIINFILFYIYLYVFYIYLLLLLLLLTNFYYRDIQFQV